MNGSLFKEVSPIKQMCLVKAPLISLVKSFIDDLEFVIIIKVVLGDATPSSVNGVWFLFKINIKSDLVCKGGWLLTGNIYLAVQ